MTGSIRFLINYRGKEKSEAPLNPRVNIRVYSGGSQILGQDTSYSALELWFCVAMLEAIEDLLVKDQDQTWIEFDDGTILLLEKEDGENVKMTNVFSEGAIDNKSKRIGIETSSVVSTMDLKDAVVSMAKSILRRIENHHPDNDDDRVTIAKEKIGSIIASSN